jgi:hypothetical protein
VCGSRNKEQEQEQEQEQELFLKIFFVLKGENKEIDNKSEGEIRD